MSQDPGFEVFWCGEFVFSMWLCVMLLCVMLLCVILLCDVTVYDVAVCDVAVYGSIFHKLQYVNTHEGP